jgi:hypothetical protein
MEAAGLSENADTYETVSTLSYIEDLTLLTVSATKFVFPSCQKRK